MNKTQLAALLNGREYCEEITKEECAAAKRAGLLVIFGANDDSMELRGAFEDEVSCYGGGTFYLTRRGLLATHSEEDCNCAFCGYGEAKAKAKAIEAVWCDYGYSWTYWTEIPHATFKIVEDGEKFCRGIVIDIADL